MYGPFFLDLVFSVVHFILVVGGVYLLYIVLKRIIEHFSKEN